MILYAIAIIAYVGAALVLGIMGRRRKLGGWGYFFASLMLTPVIGLLLVLASDRRADP